MRMKIEAEVIDVAVPLNLVPGDKIIIINGVVVAAQPHNAHRVIEVEKASTLQRLGPLTSLPAVRTSDDEDVLATLNTIEKPVTNKEIAAVLGWNGPTDLVRTSNALRRLADRKQIIGMPGSATSTRNRFWRPAREMGRQVGE